VPPGCASSREAVFSSEASHNQEPQVINVDKNAVITPTNRQTQSQTLPKTAELRPVKYLNNIVEQDHRFIKRLVNPGMGLAHSIARRTGGLEAMNMIRKDKLLGVAKGDILGQVIRVSNFQVTA